MVHTVISLLIEVVKQKVTWICSTTILALVLAFTIFQEPVDTSSYYEEIDRLEQEIQELTSRDTDLVNEVDSLRTLYTYFSNQNSKLLEDLEILQQTYEDDTTFIDSASIDELTEFLTNRYRHLLRSTP